ncbi:MAG TPA: glycosyl hydrolase family 18 protein [Edaphobacter sp.]|nr:glycosyl hydrolase family 18 protein [Edaphobacter sp.]
MPVRRSLLTCLPLLLLLVVSPGYSQNSDSNSSLSVPNFTRSYTAGGKNYSYTVVGNEPAKGGTTTIPTVLVPITLSFEAPADTTGRKASLDASTDTNKVIHSPIFQKYAFSSGTTQYADAMQRASFNQAAASATRPWHTLLSQPKVTPVKITIPVGYGYVLTSKKNGQMMAVVDIQYLQKQLFKQLPKQAPGSLVLAVTKDTTYYTLADATVCCSWGTHGVDTSAGNRQSFVLASYLTPNSVSDSDIQPITQQLAQWFMDPQLNPLAEYRDPNAPGNVFPAWMRPQKDRGCGGTGIAQVLFLTGPTDTNPRSNFPSSPAYVANLNGTSYHLQNVALIPWYTQVAESGAKNTYSFPDANVLTAPATACPVRRPRGGSGPFGSYQSAAANSVQPIAMTGGPNGHQLIGYWSGYGRIRDVSPQWDIIIVAFATPVKGQDGLMQYHVNGSQTPEQFKADILEKQREGKKVMISLGGGGQFFTINTQEGVKNFISSVEQIVTEYHFDGIDLDYESPSFILDPGDTDFRHPTTPGIVNIISALHELRKHFGPKFMISLVPEGTQISAGYPSYGGQFGTYIPILQGIRDILTFVDSQDYNTPPLEGLDGEFYQLGTVDYHAAVTELVLHGFPVGRNPKHFFEPLPPEKVAVGFITGESTPEIVNDTMRYLITGKASTPTTYKLQNPAGYPTFNGAMFWTIDADRRENYRYSNSVGPLLHSFPATAVTK